MMGPYYEARPKTRHLSFLPLVFPLFSEGGETIPLNFLAVHKMESAILLLTGTILETLYTGPLQTWMIQRKGLADAMEKLRLEVERIGMVCAAVENLAAENKLLGQSLARLQDLLYEADDLVDELDYHRLLEASSGKVYCP
jgi:hypothetical protein